MREIGEVVLLGERQRRHIFHRLDQCDAPFGHLSHRPDDFRVALVADEKDVLALLDLTFGLAMDFADKRAGRIDIEQLAPVGLCGHGLGHAMRREYDRHIVRHLVQFLDEDRALGLQRIDHIAIMDDLVPYIDRRTVFLERALHDFDGAVDTCTKAAWRGDQQLERQARVGIGRTGGLKGSVHTCPSSALHRAKLGDASPALDRATNCMRIADDMTTRTRFLATAGLGLAVAGCANPGELVVDQAGAGITALRTTCPAVGIPDYTGNITLFRSPTSRTTADLDVTAALTDLTSTCNETGEKVYSEASFNVVARRTDTRGARQVQLPYFSTVLRGGSSVVTKRIGTVTLNFADGQDRAEATGKAGAFVDRAAATLPENIRQKITARRKPGDPDAALDPLADPEVRAAVQSATFELLVGFQLTQDQLRYNVTR